MESRQVIVNFKGGTVTSDAGLTLIAALDQKRQITSRFAACFQDYRDPSRVEHTLETLVAQRVYGLVQGYEDLNDHDQLRHDPMFAVALGKLSATNAVGAPMAGKSTLNRIEHCPVGVTNRQESRYHRIGHDPKAMQGLFVELFLESQAKPPRQIVLDLDVTDDQVHGHQEQAFFNTYYNGVCYAPLYLFCGKHLLVAKLRPCNVDPAEGALEEVQRVIGQIHARWPQTRILVRGDSAYSREDIMAWCESQGIDYVFGLASNARLMRMTIATQEKALAEYRQLFEPVTWYRSLHYKTLNTWSRFRRVVAKVAYGPEGFNLRFVVTSLPAQRVSPSQLYTQQYCPRGEMENRFKEQQLELFSDRTSTHTFQGNQLRLWFSSLAYVLMHGLRESCLATTELAHAQVGTIRTKLLKLGARVLISVRRIQIAISTGCPFQAIFATAYRKLQTLPNTG
jgi:hypothetical protein